MSMYPRDWPARLRPLREIDWRKTNKDWQGTCMIGTDIVTRRQMKQTTTEFLRERLGLGNLR
jgi:DNA sulfur modification protein DndB